MDDRAIAAGAGRGRARARAVRRARRRASTTRRRSASGSPALWKTRRGSSVALGSVVGIDGDDAGRDRGRRGALDARSRRRRVARRARRGARGQRSRDDAPRRDPRGKLEALAADARGVDLRRAARRSRRARRPGRGDVRPRVARGRARARRRVGARRGTRADVRRARAHRRRASARPRARSRSPRRCACRRRRAATPSSAGGRSPLEYRTAPRTTGAGWSAIELADGRLALLATEAQAHGVAAALATAALTGAFAAATTRRRRDGHARRAARDDARERRRRDARRRAGRGVPRDPRRRARRRSSGRAPAIPARSLVGPIGVDVELPVGSARGARPTGRIGPGAARAVGASLSVATRGRADCRPTTLLVVASTGLRGGDDARWHETLRERAPPAAGSRASLVEAALRARCAERGPARRRRAPQVEALRCAVMALWLIPRIPETACASIFNILRGAGGEPSRLWLAGGAIVRRDRRFHSCASVEAGQVAVRVNNVTGSMEVITQPGLITAAAVRHPRRLHPRRQPADVPPARHDEQERARGPRARRPRVGRLELRVQRHDDPVPRDSRARPTRRCATPASTTRTTSGCCRTRARSCATSSAASRRSACRTRRRSAQAEDAREAAASTSCSASTASRSRAS